MRRWLSFAWRWSAVATLPVAIVFVWWALGTLAQWKTFAVDYDAYPVVVDLHDVGVDRWRHMVRSMELALSPHTIASQPPDRALRTVQLLIGDSELSKLDGNLPYSGFEFVDGRLLFPDGLHQVAIKYRGDFLVHWGYEKKSLRVRTKNKELFDGLSSFNLIVPKYTEQVNNCLGYRLAGELGLMAPRCEIVNVTINGRNAGLHELTEQIDEGTLRRCGQPVGEIFAGELISKDQYEGVNNNRVFELPGLWEPLVDAKKHTAGVRAPLEALMRLLDDTPSEANAARLSALLDMRAFGAFGAFELLTQTHHYDESHNWRLAWDPWDQKFRPIVWDPIPWIFELRPQDGGPIGLDYAVSRLSMSLHRNGDFLAARSAALREFLAGDAAERFLADVDRTFAAVRDAEQFDPNVRPTDPDEIAQGMVDCRAFLERTFRELRAAYLEPSGEVRFRGPDAAGTLAIEVTGRQPVDAIELRFAAPVRTAGAAHLRWWHDGEVTEVDLTGGVRVQDNTLRVPARLFCQQEPLFRFMPGQLLRQHTLAPMPAYYELQFEQFAGLPADQLVEVAALRGERFERAVQVQDLPRQDLDWLYQPAPAQPARAPEDWRGEIAITGVREIERDLTIEPGTTVRFAPGASLLLRGRVDARGDRERPIRFLPAAAEQGPWGAVALLGPGASGSVFRGCEWRGGSGCALGLLRLPAMFAVQGCSDVLLADCTFADAVRERAMVHFAHAEVRCERVEWRHAATDALAAVLSRVELTGCRIADAGGDGLDLTTAQALVADSQFEKVRGAGLRADEGSALLAVRTLLRDCQRGVEARDGTCAWLANCELRGCQRAAVAAHKNWRYASGGALTVAKSLLAGNKMPAESDHRSDLQVLDCQVVAPEKDKSDVDWTRLPPENHARFVDCDGGPGPKHRAPLPFPAMLSALESLARKAWSTVRTDVRGGRREQ